MRNLLVALIVSLSALAAHAGEPVSISHAKIRLAPNVGATTAGYLRIENTGDAPIRLLAAATEAAARVEIHEMAMQDGVMSMRPLENGLTIAAGDIVTLAPRGLHLMIMGTRQALAVGDVVGVDLDFEDIGTIHVEFTVTTLGDILKSQ